MQGPEKAEVHIAVYECVLLKVVQHCHISALLQDGRCALPVSLPSCHERSQINPFGLKPTLMFQD